MRGVATYTLAGLLALTGMEVVVPGFGPPASGWPSVSPAEPEDDVSIQRVDRARKGDRLDRMHSVVGKRRGPAPLMRGCEPAFSPLTVTVEAGNRIRRCVA